MLRDSELEAGGEADACLDRRHEQVDELRHLPVDLLDPQASAPLDADVGQYQPITASQRGTEETLRRSRPTTATASRISSACRPRRTRTR